MNRNPYPPINRLCRSVMLGVALAVSLATVTNAQLLSRRYCGRSCLRDGIPAGQYQVTVDSVTKWMFSMPAISNESNLEQTVNEVERLATEGATRSLFMNRARTKTFEFSKLPLRVDHCSISQLGVAVSSDGHWDVNLLAEQNSRSAEEAKRHVAWHRQNEFVLVLRFYGEFQLDPLMIAAGNGLPQLSRPALAQLGPIEFYVQNGQAYPLSVSGPEGRNNVGGRNVALSRTRFPPRVSHSDVHLLLRRHFDQIDRVGVAFRYRGGEVVHPYTESSVQPQ